MNVGDSFKIGSRELTVAGWGVKGAAVEGLTVEGNGERAGGVDGCRAGGVYLFRCEDVTIRNCTVRGYNGDGISFQVSQRVTVEGWGRKRSAGRRSRARTSRSRGESRAQVPG